MRLARNVARVERGDVLTRLWWENLRERDHGRPRRRWECNIKMDIKKVLWIVDWIDLAQDRDQGGGRL